MCYHGDTAIFRLQATWVFCFLAGSQCTCPSTHPYSLRSHLPLIFISHQASLSYLYLLSDWHHPSGRQAGPRGQWIETKSDHLSGSAGKGPTFWGSGESHANQLHCGRHQWPPCHLFPILFQVGTTWKLLTPMPLWCHWHFDFTGIFLRWGRRCKPLGWWLTKRLGLLREKQDFQALFSFPFFCECIFVCLSHLAVVRGHDLICVEFGGGGIYNVGIGTQVTASVTYYASNCLNLFMASPILF